jgi:thermostable 8-oxoguanine DNA glycosylase
MNAEDRNHWKIEWLVDDFQIDIVRDFYNTHKNNAFVKRRESKNVLKQGLDLSKENIWKALVACLLTTQQKSGPGSRVAKFLANTPFPLNLQACLDNLHRLDVYSLQVLKDFGGFRRSSVIAKELQTNLQEILKSEWFILKEITHYDITMDDKGWEQSLARTMQHHIKGFGPKQSRNFLQILGITKYEIPLDSRVIDWLNTHNFPLHLTATGLADPYYYQLVSDGIQQLCEQAEIYPCLLDAAIFSGKDKEYWTEENAIF